MNIDTPNYWQKRWEQGLIHFHLEKVQPILIDQFANIYQPKARILLPFCGKTLDIAYFLQQGCSVVGIELSLLAVEQLFTQLKHDLGAQLGEITVTQHGDYQLFSANHIQVWVGDLFGLSQERIGKIDAIYDRAALVALPLEMRAAYAAKLRELSQTAPMLLIGFNYLQSQMPGPPFSIDAHAVSALYAEFYHIDQCTDKPVRGGLKGLVEAREFAWLLAPR